VTSRAARATCSAPSIGPWAIELDSGTASGRAYICELIRFRDGRSELNYSIYHDRYRRTPDGWKFTERVYEVRYLDHSPLAGSAPGQGALADPPATAIAAAPDRSCPAVMEEEAT
jgi:hypothetical protein